MDDFHFSIPPLLHFILPLRKALDSNQMPFSTDALAVRARNPSGFTFLLVGREGIEPPRPRGTGFTIRPASIYGTTNPDLAENTGFEPDALQHRPDSNRRREPFPDCSPETKKALPGIIAGEGFLSCRLSVSYDISSPCIARSNE